ncbi:MAG: DUF1491 family protein [Sphingomonas bacterium]|nr:DUF1491 family protein [Sphingomonas bacterium]
MRPRDRHLPALAHRFVEPRRVSTELNDARLPAKLEASSLLRRAEVDGGFGMIIAKGDPDRGALILLIASRGEHVCCLERGLTADGDYAWQRAGPGSDATPAEVENWSDKRRKFDRDSWLIELDVPHPERFIAETTAIG